MLTTNSKNEDCRFYLFVRLNDKTTFKFEHGKQENTYRGDGSKRRITDPAERLKYLVGIINNYRPQYGLMLLYDNSIPADDPKRTITKILHGIPKYNRLTDYKPLLGAFIIPRDLAYPID